MADDDREQLWAQIATAKREIAEAVDAGNASEASKHRRILKVLLDKENLLLAKDNLVLEQRGKQDAVSDFVGQFMKKLAEERIDTPNPLAMQRLVMNFPGPMRAAAQQSAASYIARLLYQQALCLPGTNTRLLLANNGQGISVNGCLRHDTPSLVTAVDLQSGSMLVVKILPHGSEEQKPTATAELQALDTLALHSQPEGGVLVPMQLVNVDVGQQDVTIFGMAGATYSALRMPMFATSLDRVPQLTQELIHQGGRRLQTALQIMHGKGLVHADVKAGNVFLNDATKWCLGDYGSCVKIDERIVSCTEGWYPGQLRFAQAQPKHDWGLLVVLLAVELDKANMRGLTGSSEPQVVQMDLLLARCRGATHDGLMALLRELFSDAGWDLPGEASA